MSLINQNDWIKFRHSVKLQLEKFPWLRRRIEKTIWHYKASYSRKQRAKVLPELLEKNVIKPQKVKGPRHIIMIVVDSLRKGNCSLYGYDRETTPFLKSLADDAAVFENAIAPSSWTFPSLCSLLTGIYPHKHGGVHPKKLRNFWNEVPNKARSDLLTLPELLSVYGFKTNYITAISTGALAAAEWFGQSCVFYGAADLHVKEFLRWMKKNKNEKTFVILQLGDVHYPISVPPVSYRNMFGEIADLPDLAGWQYLTDGQPGDRDFEFYRENRIKLYDCALRYVDDQIGRVVEFLDKEGLRDSSLVFVTADHGEEFWDHVEVQRKLFYDPRGTHGVHGTAHGHNFFQELINVPLLCMGSDVPAGRYNHYVSLLDFVPTVLEMLDIEHNLDFDGYNFFKPLEGRYVISEGTAYGYEKKAVIKNGWKLIYSEGDNVCLLYDLANDPQEKHNLAESNPEKLIELKALLSSTQTEGEALEIDQEIKDQLRHLGYMS